MNRSNIIIVVLFVGLVGFFVYLNSLRTESEAVKWQFNYRYDQGKLAHDRDFFIDLMRKDRGSDKFEELKERFSKQEDLKTNDLYLYYNESFNPDQTETDSILKFVARGNSALIIANRFGWNFENRLPEVGTSILGMWTGGAWGFDSAHYVTDKLGIVPDTTERVNVSVTVFGPYQPFPTSFYIDTFDYELLDEQFEFEDDVDDYMEEEFVEEEVLIEEDDWERPECSFEIVGSFEKYGANLIKVKYGKGTILLHSNPALFTNIQMDKPEIFDYANKVLVQLDYDKVYWDELRFQFLNTNNDNGFSSESYFKHIFENRALKTAFYFLLFGLLFFLLFGMKRRFNTIAIVEPLTNSSIEFSKTIARLYWLNPDHKKMANLKVKMFLSEIRNRYGLSTHKLDDEFREKFMAKSGVGERHVKRLFDAYIQVQKKVQIHEDLLIQISESIAYIRQMWK